MRTQRNQLNLQELKTSELELLHFLKPLLSNISSIAIYNATNNEVSLLPIIKYCLSKKIAVYQPISYKHTRVMRFSKVEQLSELSDKIFYPQDYVLNQEITWYNIQLILLPLLACDVTGNRLGYGGGYYDTTFYKFVDGQILCGVGYSWQLLKSIINHEEHDRKLDYFVSDHGLVKF